MRATRPLTFEQRHVDHDAMGNAPHLLDPVHAAKIVHGHWRRASGDVVCERCNKLYYDHPHVVGALWLVETCDGRLVKL